MGNSPKEVKALREQLELKRKELHLILAIDHIRDTTPEPVTMLTAIVDVLADELSAELCLLCLVDRESGDLELKAINERGKQFGHLTATISRDLARRAVQADGVVIWQADEVLPELGHESPLDLSSLQMAAVPIIMGPEERLGAVLLARTASPFGPTETQLLKTAESQIDSAVVQIYAHYELQQRNKELETIYRVDNIRDQHLPFDDMLNAVLQELRAVIQAEMGFIMLYNHAGQQLELRSATNDDLFRVSPHYELVTKIANESLHRAELVCYNDLSNHLHSVMCIPLILRERIIGVLGVVNRYGPRGFDAEDRRLLSAIGSQMDTAIFESLEQRRLREVLGRSVDPRVMERLLAAPNVDFLKGERSELSVLYADIRGSTGLAERTDPELLVGFINHYLGRMTEVILAHEGTLDKFVGDEVMALFSAPFPQPNHALRAVEVGLEMQAAHQEVIDIWRGRGVEATPIGVGIATGELIVGEMGCPQRTDYTVIGRAANLGARLCSAAHGGQVLISQRTFDLVRDLVDATAVTGLQLKGMSNDLVAYSVNRLLV